MFNLAQRNLKIFFRQKSSVFFSMLGVFIIIGLYVLFLGDVWKDSLKDLAKVDVLMNSWIMAGILSVTSITTTMGAFEIMVEDKARKNSRDFYASPIRRSKIVGGYLTSAYLVGLLMTLLAFVLGELYIASTGGAVLPPLAILEVFGILLLSVLASSALVFFLVSFFSSNSAFSTASSVLGTLIGFVTGIYLPIGSLPDAVQWVIKLFPVSHAGALLRQVMLRGPIADSFAGVPDSYLAEFQQEMGVTFTYGGYTATPVVHILVLAGTAALFFALALWNVSRKKKSI